MSITLPVTGQSNWDVPLNDALSDAAVGSFDPNDHGFVAWAYDPAHASINATFTTLNMKMVKLPKLPAGGTISTLWVHIAVAPTALVAGQSFLGLYNTSGTLLASTADLSADFTTIGLKSGALTVPYAAAEENYYVGILANATTTTPAFSLTAANAAVLANANLSTAASRFALTGGALTALPASVTMGSITPSRDAHWAAAS